MLFSALLLSLALIQGPSPMSELHSNTFDSGAALTTYYTPYAVNFAAVVVNTALGGVYNVQVQPGAVSDVGNFLVGQGKIFDPDPLVVPTRGTTPLTPSGRLFRITGCFDYDSALSWSTPATYDGPFGIAMIAGRSVPDAITYPAYDAIFNLFQGGYDDTQAFVRLYGNSGLGSPILASDYLFPKAGPHTIAVEVLMSTITDGDDHGGGSAASDGYIKVYVDGAQVITYTGQQVGHYIDNQGPPTFWNTWANVTDPFTYVQFGVVSHVKNICIRDDGLDCGFTCVAGELVGGVPPITGTVPTCCDTSTGPGDTGTNPDPVGTLPPWIANCVDGGVVDAVADLTDGEVW